VHPAILFVILKEPPLRPVHSAPHRGGDGRIYCRRARGCSDELVPSMRRV